MIQIYYKPTIMSLNFNNSCFCGGDAPDMETLSCGHNIHHSCAVQMVSDACPWCRKKMNIMHVIKFNVMPNTTVMLPPGQYSITYQKPRQSHNRPLLLRHFRIMRR
jgi:hypothetical protein